MILSDSLADVRAALEAIGIDPSGAVLGLGLWGLDYDRREITLWGSSDRVHVDTVDHHRGPSGLGFGMGGRRDDHAGVGHRIGPGHLLVLC